jgi:hypothetical protein
MKQSPPPSLTSTSGEKACRLVLLQGAETRASTHSVLKTALRETFIISDGSGGIGSIVQESLMSRRLRCETDSNESEIPQEIMLFLAWLALIIRKKDAASAG